MATACGSESDTALPVNSEFFAADGSASTLAEFQGQPIVLNFFASWCPPCVAELPEFEEISKEVGDAVQFVGINTDFQQDAWLRLVEVTGVTYPTFFQPSSALYVATESPSMPTTVFLDENGNVAFTHAGRLSKSGLRELIDTHLL
jgi:thiol-disulfide isomerase/thioredoxin